jgi:hypothetical protein
MTQFAEHLIERAPPVKRFLHKLGTRPGWAWLLIVLTLAGLWLPEHIRFFGTEYDLSTLPSTILVLVAAYVFYWLGDAINDWVWKKRIAPYKQVDRFTHEALEKVEKDGSGLNVLWMVLGIKRGIRAVEKPRQTAQDWIGVTDGSYKVALRLAEAAEEDLDGGVQWPNEVAKSLRSLAVPLAVLGVALAVGLADWRYGTLVLVGFACFWAYIFLKFTHMRRLYEAVNNLKARKQVRGSDHTLDDGRMSRTFLVNDGRTVSALLPKKDKGAAPVPPLLGSQPAVAPSGDPTMRVVHRDKSAVGGDASDATPGSLAERSE